jgi:serine/threonine protein kinase
MTERVDNPSSRRTGPLPPEGAGEALELQDLVDQYLSPTTRIAAGCGEETQPPEERLGPGRVCTLTNQYVLREKIGQGGMGVVYRAYDEKLKRDVALKLLLRTDGDLLERFIREQEIMGYLDHPNFVRVFSSGYLSLKDRSLPFYTMPLIRGRNLERLILRREVKDAGGEHLRREYPLPSLLRMLGQLCLTIQSAHDKRIIHRDLKPSNILVGPYGDVYVTDLGLAKLLSAKPTETVRFEAHVMEQLAKAAKFDITQDTIMGTPYYMAPEQGYAPGDVDHRVDIFGLGGILYFIMTGRRPQYAEPAINWAALKSRRASILAQLGLDPESEPAVILLLARPRGDLARETRPLVEELRDIEDLLVGSEYQRFRFTMKECVILSPREVLARAGEGPSPDPGLEALCMKAMAKRPQDRFASCRVFWQAIQDYLANAEDRGSP